MVPTRRHNYGTAKSKVTGITLTFLGVAAFFIISSVFPTPAAAYIMFPRHPSAIGSSSSRDIAAASTSAGYHLNHHHHKNEPQVRQRKQKSSGSSGCSSNLIGQQQVQQTEDDRILESKKFAEEGLMADEGTGRAMIPSSGPRQEQLRQQPPADRDSMSSQFEPGTSPAFSRSSSAVIDMPPPTLQRRTMLYDPATLGPAGRAFMEGCGSPEECDLRFSNYLGILLNMMTNGKRK